MTHFPELVERAAKEIDPIAFGFGTNHLGMSGMYKQRKSDARACAARVLATALGGDYVIVPREPTAHQHNAGFVAAGHQVKGDDVLNIYRAMIAAAGKEG